MINTFMRVAELVKKSLPIPVGVGTFAIIQSTLNATTLIDKPVWLVMALVATTLGTVVTTYLINKTKVIIAKDAALIQLKEVNSSTENKRDGITLQIFDRALAEAREERANYQQLSEKERATFQETLKEQREYYFSQLASEHARCDEREKILRDEKHKVISEASEYKIKAFMFKQAAEKEGYIVVESSEGIKLVREQKI